MPAVLSRDKLDAVNTTVNAIFTDALEQSGDGPLFGAITMPITSTQVTETYNWLDDFSELRKWVGPRYYPTFEAKGLTVVNEEYESSMAIKRIDIITDRLGMLENRVRRLPENYFRGRRALLANLVINGHTTTGAGGAGYDGVAFFSNAHPNGDLANQSNIASSGTALSATSFDVAMAQMEGLVNHKGEPLDISPDTLVIGPSNRAAARSLFQVSTLSGGGENPHYQLVPKVIVEQRISGNAWYLFDSKHVNKAIIDQILVPMEFASMVNLNDPNVFEQNEFHWGIYAAFGMGYGFWQTAYRNAGP